MSDSPIINLAGEPVTVIKRRSALDYCVSRCQQVLVDPHLRQITCRECGKVLDAFTWVAKMAQEESYLQQRIHNLKLESESRAERVEELRADEQKTKARIRSAKASVLNSLLERAPVDTPAGEGGEKK